MDSFLERLGNTADACVAIDVQQRLVFLNGAARALLDTDAEVLGRHCYEVVAGHDGEGLSCRQRCLISRMVQNGHLVADHDLLVGRGQDRMWVNVSTVVLAEQDRPGAPWLVHYMRPLKDHGADPALDVWCEEQAAASLTYREREVIVLLAQGTSTQIIARQLGISTATARNHIQHILGKLMAHSRMEAVLVAQEQHLIQSR